MDTAPTTHPASEDLSSRMLAVDVDARPARPGGPHGWRVASAALLLALVAAACGGDEAASSAEDDTGDEAAVVGDDVDRDASDHDGPDTAARAGSYDAAPELVIDVTADYRATIVTDLGVIEVELYARDAPVTVNNFAFLARDGYYDGLTFHRVIPGFVAQGGDPLGSGMGGPGYAFEDELTVAERDGYALGTLAMANSGPDTNGSQFFLTVADVDLPPLYAVFGRVSSGSEVLAAIAAQATDAGDRPLEDVRIHTIEVEGP